MRHRLPHYALVSQRLRLSDPGVSVRSTGVTPGTLRVFNEGKVALEEILRRVRGARSSIEMRAFLWRDDEAGNRLGHAIFEAAERGVEVTIHKDRIAAVYEYTGGNKQSFFHKRVAPTQGFQAWFLGAVYRAPGSFKQRPNPLAEAILGHPNITVNHKRRRFDHSKLFIFDERYITLGSMGIGDNHHREWVDVMVELDGPEHVRRLRQRLTSEVAFDPGRDIDFLVHIRQNARRRGDSLLAQRLSLIEAAEHSLTIEMAYLGDRRFTAALLRAIQRGVDVTLVTAAQADVLGNLNRATCDTLIRRTGGAENLTIVFLPRMVHSKIVVVDDRICDIGSANFTPLSHGVYDEINLYAVDPDFARDVKDVIAVHTREGEVVERRIGYRRIRSQVERVIVAYQARKGQRLRLLPSPKAQERAARRSAKRSARLLERRAARRALDLQKKRRKPRLLRRRKDTNRADNHR
jgi:cardiolipin synthase